MVEKSLKYTTDFLQIDAMEFNGSGFYVVFEMVFSLGEF